MHFAAPATSGSEWQRRRRPAASDYGGAMELAGVIVERIRPPAAAAVAIGDPFRSAPARVPDTLRVVRPWRARGVSWWLVAIAATGWPAVLVARTEHSLVWAAALLIPPLWFCWPVIRRIRPTAELEVTGPELRFRTAPWRDWTRVPVRGGWLVARRDTGDDRARQGFALLLFRPDVDPIRIITVDHAATADGLKRLLETELWLRDAAPARPPHFALGPLVDALAMEADEH
jgi:hypothetical protein